MTQVIRVAHSPDSDDAFMFWALAHDKVDTEGLTFEHHLGDIQSLNEAASTGKYEVTAISYFAYPGLQDKYALMSSGSSIGDKYGPVLISKTPMSKEDLEGKPIAVPGLKTSAYLALKIWWPEAQVEVVPFDQIMERVEDGTYAADLDGAVDPGLMSERLAELRELQDDITATRRDALIGQTLSVLVDTVGVGRSHREAPEIDGVIHLDEALAPGSIVEVEIVDALGPDLVAAGVSVDALETI